MTIEPTDSGSKPNKSRKKYKLLIRELLIQQQQVIDELLTKQHKFNLLLLKQCKLMFESNGARTASTGESIDQLVSEMLGVSDVGLEGAEGAAGAQVRAAPPKHAPTPRSVPTAPPEKAKEKAPTPPAKIKPSPVDEDREPLVARKYWAILGGLAFLLVCVYWLTYSSRPDAAGLGKTALGASKVEDRLDAAAQLTIFPGEQAIDQIKLLVKESKDPQVVVRMIPVLARRSSTGPTWDLLIDTLKNPEVSVRTSAWQALQGMLPLSEQEKASFKPDDPANSREPAVKLLKDKYSVAPRDAPSAPPGGPP